MKAAAALVELPLVEPDDCGLANHRGVVSVEPVPGRVAVRVGYDPDLCSLDCLDETARELRLDLGHSYAHRLCRIEGMDYADCAQTTERAVARMAGVTHVALSFPAASMRVEYRPGEVELDRIASQLGRLGDHVGRPAGELRALGFFGWLTRERTTLPSAAPLVLALALVMSLVVIRLIRRPSGGNRTFGLKRTEILSAQANGATLLVLAGLIVYEGIRPRRERRP